jgi:hypothetical protein
MDDMYDFNNNGKYDSHDAEILEDSIKSQREKSRGLGIDLGCFTPILGIAFIFLFLGGIAAILKPFDEDTRPIVMFFISVVPTIITLVFLNYRDRHKK